METDVLTMKKASKVKEADLVFSPTLFASPYKNHNMYKIFKDRYNPGSTGDKIHIDDIEITKLMLMNKLERVL